MRTTTEVLTDLFPAAEPSRDACVLSASSRELECTDTAQHNVFIVISPIGSVSLGKKTNKQLLLLLRLAPLVQCNFRYEN